MSLSAQDAAMFRQMQTLLHKQAERQRMLEQQLALLQSRPRSISEEIDAIPGRRIDTWMHGEQDFTISNAGRKGNPILIPVSQDGQFIWTHYPLVGWYPTAPDTTTNLNMWRPVTIFPLPDQVVDTDFINLQYEVSDGGNQRGFQNGPRGPLFSRPDNLVPCPCPTLWAPNSTIGFTPNYLSITFNSAVPPTSGKLTVDFIGYRIVNL